MKRVDHFRKRTQKKPEFYAVIKYVPLPPELKHRTYREWVRLYIKGEAERLKRERLLGSNKRDADE